MALVAYGSSGESDSEEEDVPNIQSAEFKSKTGSKDLKDNDSLPTRPDKLDKVRNPTSLFCFYGTTFLCIHS